MMHNPPAPNSVAVLRFIPTLRGETNPNLTPREIQVVTAIVGGTPNGVIADNLGIAYETLKRHLYSAMKKTGMPNRTTLAIHAVLTGLVSLDGVVIWGAKQ
jgi:DNA-binding NarL/FixJ family response regulator